MATITTVKSYDLKGKKLSFANWISNLSPTETPFVSMTGKEAISQTKFQWQTDVLETPNPDNAQIEGSKPTESTLVGTQVKTNVTQILRKVVAVSDSANVVASYGRGKEGQYQLEKAGMEIKRDLENAFLTQVEEAAGSSTEARKTAGFKGLVAGVDVADTDTGAIVHFEGATSGAVKEEDLFKMTYNLYLANSKANIIMFHPAQAAHFSNLIEVAPSGANRIRMFEGMDTKFNVEIDTIVDPLGQRFALVPNRFMPTDSVYFFNPGDWTQMVFRAPERTKLAKEGSYEKWMIEMEVGLRHRNPYASGILKIKA